MQQRPEKYQIDPQVMARQVGGETVILDLARGSYFGLDTVGARVWRLLEEKHIVADIVAILLEEYDVDEDKLLADLAELFDTMETRGLIHRGEIVSPP